MLANVAAALATAPTAPNPQDAPKQPAPAAPAPVAPSAATPANAATPTAAPVAAKGRPDLAGAWRSAADGPDPFVQLVFARAGDPQAAPWSLMLSLPLGGIMDRALEDASVVEDRSFTASTKVGGATIAFAGALAADGTTIEGTIGIERGGNTQQLPMKLVPTAIASSITGATRYTAVLEAMGAKLPMGLTLADAGDLGWVGSVDIPAQGLNGLPVIVDRSDAGEFVVTLPVGTRAVMTLKPAEDGSTLEGTFAQGPISAPIRFERGDAPVKGTLRPQEPKPPFPYTDREVTVPCEEGHTLAGTLTIPDSARAGQRVPGVVMLTGSGAQDRDEALAGHKPFLVIADALARAGIAVLRCDDRGFGRSTGDAATATSRDFANDGRAMMRFLRTQPEIDPALCGYVGHSEGGLTGPLAAMADQDSGSPVAFVVLLAGPAVTGAEILALQTKRILLAQGIPEEDAVAISDANRAALRAVIDGAEEAKIRSLLVTLLRLQREAAARHAGVEAPSVEDDGPEIDAVLKSVRSKWLLEFISHDPAPTLAAVKAPMLAINGDLDTQIDTEQNLLRIEAIRREAGLPVTIRRYPNLNHLLQPATTGGIDEYAQIETTIDPAVLEELARWIRETTLRAGADAGGAAGARGATGAAGATGAE